VLPPDADKFVLHPNAVRRPDKAACADTVADVPAMNACEVDASTAEAAGIAAAATARLQPEPARATAPTPEALAGPVGNLVDASSGPGPTATDPAPMMAVAALPGVAVLSAATLLGSPFSASMPGLAVLSQTSPVSGPTAGTPVPAAAVLGQRSGAAAPIVSRNSETACGGGCGVCGSVGSKSGSGNEPTQSVRSAGGVCLTAVSPAHPRDDDTRGQQQQNRSSDGTSCSAHAPATSGESSLVALTCYMGGELTRPPNTAPARARAHPATTVVPASCGFDAIGASPQLGALSTPSSASHCAAAAHGVGCWALGADGGPGAVPSTVPTVGSISTEAATPPPTNSPAASCTTALSTSHGGGSVPEKVGDVTGTTADAVVAAVEAATGGRGGAAIAAIAAGVTGKGRGGSGEINSTTGDSNLGKDGVGGGDAECMVALPRGAVGMVAYAVLEALPPPAEQLRYLEAAPTDFGVPLEVLLFPHFGDDWGAAAEAGGSAGGGDDASGEANKSNSGDAAGGVGDGKTRHNSRGDRAEGAVQPSTTERLRRAVADLGGRDQPPAPPPSSWSQSPASAPSPPPPSAVPLAPLPFAGAADAASRSGAEFVALLSSPLAAAHPLYAAILGKALADCARNAAAREALGRDGVASPLAVLLRSPVAVRHPGVAAQLGKAVARLCVDSATNRTRLGEAGIPSALVALLTQSPAVTTHIAVATYLCNAVAMLCGSSVDGCPANRQRFTAAGLVGPLLALFASPAATHVVVGKQACLALACLCHENPPARRRLREAGAPECLGAFVGQHCANKKMEIALEWMRGALTDPVTAGGAKEEGSEGRKAEAEEEGAGMEEGDGENRPESSRCCLCAVM